MRDIDCARHLFSRVTSPWALMKQRAAICAGCATIRILGIFASWRHLIPVFLVNRVSRSPSFGAFTPDWPGCACSSSRFERQQCGKRILAAEAFWVQRMTSTVDNRHCDYARWSLAKRNARHPEKTTASCAAIVTQRERCDAGRYRDSQQAAVSIPL
jgi:hypothetical protein